MRGTVLLRNFAAATRQVACSRAWRWSPIQFGARKERPFPTTRMRATGYQHISNLAEFERDLSETMRARVIVAAIAGMTLEWYDFVVFGFFARTIGQIFFPAGPETSLLMVTATFGAGFVPRPLGAVVLG